MCHSSPPHSSHADRHSTHMFHVLFPPHHTSSHQKIKRVVLCFLRRERPPVCFLEEHERPRRPHHRRTCKSSQQNNKRQQTSTTKPNTLHTQTDLVWVHHRLAAERAGCWDLGLPPAGEHLGPLGHTNVGHQVRLATVQLFVG